MIKKIVFATVAVALLSALPAAALDFQQKQWYAQGIVAFPMGDFSNLANLGFGAGVGLHVPHDADWSFRGEFSYVYFTTEDVPGFDYSVSQIPITVLAQYSLKDSEFYFLGGLGLAFYHISMDMDLMGETASASNTDTKFEFVLGAGYAVSPKVDLGARFNFIGDGNSFSAHVAYKF